MFNLRYRLMNEYLKIGQLDATGASVSRTGGKLELQRQAALDGMRDLLARRFRSETEMPVRRHRQLVITRLHKRSFGGNQDLSSCGLGGGTPALPTGGRVKRMEPQHPEQFALVYTSEDSRQADAKLASSVLADPPYSGREVEWPSGSLSDWAEWRSVTLTHFADCNVSGRSSLLDFIHTAKIASFIGRTTAVAGETAFVTLLDEWTGERFEAECDNAILCHRGIREGDEFMWTVTRKANQTVVEFSHLPPKVVTEQELEQISREIDSRLK